jgi:hypothetical protein
VLATRASASLEAGATHTTATFPRWSVMLLFAEYDTLVVALALALPTLLFAETWACLRGAAPQALSFFLTLGAGVFALASLLNVLRFRGFAGTEVRLSVGAGVVAAAAAFALLHWGGDALLSEGAVGAGVAESLRATDALVAGAATLAPHAAGPSADAAGVAGVAEAFVAAGAGLLGAALLLPSMRYAKCIVDLKYARTRAAGALPLLYLALLAPLAAATAWVRPLVGASVLAADLVKCSADAPARDCVAGGGAPGAGAGLGESDWLALRLALVAACVALRAATFRWFVGTYLRSTRSHQLEYLQDQVALGGALVRPAGDQGARGGAGAGAGAEEEAVKHATALIEAVARVVASTCVAALHLLAPAALLASLAAALARRGAVDTGVCAALHTGLGALGLDTARLRDAHPERPATLDEGLQRLSDWALGAREGAAAAPLLSPALWRVLLSQWLWWALVVWALGALAGLVYFESLYGATVMAREELQTQLPEAHAGGAEEAKAGEAGEAGKAGKAGGSGGGGARRRRG